MAILLSSVSGTSSEVRNQFPELLRAVYLQATTIRNCPAESDWDWLTVEQINDLTARNATTFFRLP